MAESLLHSTEEFQSLIGILDNGFKIHYCSEIFTDKAAGRTGIGEWATPVVSFCDLTIAETAALHINYGNYGIALKKDWAISKGMNPVLYCNTGNILARILNDQIVEAMFGGNLSRRYEVSIQISYSKNYLGITDKRGVYTYYNEREWRYVPQQSELTDISAPEAIGKIDYEKDKVGWNTKLEPLRLTFHLTDISYIRVTTAGEIKEVVNLLRSKATTPSQNDHIDELLTRNLIFV